MGAALCVFSATAIAGDQDPAKPGATTRPAIGAIDIGDYCTVLLAPKLQDELNLSDDQREKISDLKTDLKAYLSNAIGNMRTQPTAGLIGARCHTALGMIGKKVRAVLTPEQDKTLVGLFDDQTLKTIEVVSSLTNGGPAHAGQRYVVAGAELIYTHYGEKDQPHAAAQSDPSPGKPGNNRPARTGQPSDNSPFPPDTKHTDLVGDGGGSPYVNADKNHRPVLGFAVSVGQWAGRGCVSKFQPVFEIPSELDPDNYCLAKPGYVVGGLVVNKKDAADGLQIIFVKKTDRGVDLKDTYVSPWFGYDGEGTKFKLAGEGQLVIGTFGRQGMNVNGMGLMLESADTWNIQPNSSEETKDKDLPEGATRTPMVGNDGGSRFFKVDKDNRPVIGFSIKTAKWGDRDCLRQFDPLFQKPDFVDPDDCCVAKDGYAVAGLTINKVDGPAGVRILFAKITGNTLDMHDTYTSRWFGYTKDTKQIQLACDGRLVIGTFGRQ